MKNTIGIVLIGVICACNSAPSQKAFTGLKVDIVINDNDNVLSSIINKSEFIPLETNDSSLVGEINKVVIHKTKIFVLDRFSSKSVKVFDMKGKFLYQIGKVGVKEGQYMIPFDFNIDDEKGEINVINNGTSVITYDLDGKFKRKKGVDLIAPFNFEIIKGGYALIGGSKNDNLIITDSTYRIKTKRFPFVNARVDRLLINPLQRVDDGDVIYRRNLNDTIYTIKDLNIIPRLLINFAGSKLTYGDIENQKVSDKEIAFSYRVRCYLETKDFVYIFFTKAGVPYVALNEKSVNKSEVFKYAALKNDITYEKFSPLAIAADYGSNRLVFAISPSSLLKSKELINRNADKKVKELVAKTTLASNPILCLASLKDKKS